MDLLLAQPARQRRAHLLAALLGVLLPQGVLSCRAEPSQSSVGTSVPGTGGSGADGSSEGVAGAPPAAGHGGASAAGTSGGTGSGGTGGEATGDGGPPTDADADAPMDVFDASDASADADGAPSCDAAVPGVFTCCGGAPCRGYCSATGQCMCAGIDGGCWGDTVCCANACASEATCMSLSTPDAGGNDGGCAPDAGAKTNLEVQSCCAEKPCRGGCTDGPNAMCSCFGIEGGCVSGTICCKSALGCVAEILCTKP